MKYGVPKYIDHIMYNYSTRKYDRLVYAGHAAQHPEWYGHTLRLYGTYALGYPGKLQNDAERLIKWAKLHGAESFIVSQHMPGYGDRKQIRKAQQAGDRNYIDIVLTDPCLLWIEKYLAEFGVNLI